jgi:lysophospholipase L1-like esterase
MALVLFWYQGQRTPSGKPEYVALGSSFAAGAGLGPLQPDSPWLCARSVNGYPPQLARKLNSAIVDMSCGGAVAGNVLHGGQFFQGAQIRVISRKTRLVTITVGGNDIGYVGDLSMLAARNSGSLFGRLVGWFWSGPKPDEDRNFTKLHSELLETVQQIQQQAPEATIVLATYPAILPPKGTCAAIGLSEAEAELMRSVADKLAATTRSVALQANARLVDMHRIGRDHNACSNSPWTAGWANASIAPFHPTPAGAQATAQSIADALHQGRPATFAH